MAPHPLSQASLPFASAKVGSAAPQTEALPFNWQQLRSSYGRALPLAMQAPVFTAHPKRQGNPKQPTKPPYPWAGDERRSLTSEALFKSLFQRFERAKPLIRWVNRQARRVEKWPPVFGRAFFWVCEPVFWLEALLSDLHQLHHLTGQDALTGLMNRGKFDLDLSEALQNSQMKAQALTLILLDCDYFKQVNDHFGHDTGDKVLQKIAQTLQGVLQGLAFTGEGIKGKGIKGGGAYRWGGDEFALLLPGLRSDEAITLARRILFAVNNTYRDTSLDKHLRERLKQPATGSHPGRDISLSIGLLSLPQPSPLSKIKARPPILDDPSFWLPATDKLLYQAKVCRNSLVYLILDEATQLGLHAESQLTGYSILGPQGLRLPHTPPR